MEKVKNMTEAEAFCDYLKKIKCLADVTIINYISTYYRHFVKLDLNQKNIDRFILEKKNSFMVRSFIKTYLEFIKRDKEFDLPKTKTGRTKKRIIRDVSDVEIKKIRKVCYANNVKDGIMFDLLYYGALRRAEITTIKTNSFDWKCWLSNPDEMCVFRVTGKGKKDRNVLAHPFTIKQILNAYLDRGLINTHMSIDDISIKLNSIDDTLIKMKDWNIWRIIKSRSKKAIERDVRPHEIRHARATELLRNGVAIRDIQQYLGHATIQTTEIYLHTKENASIDNIRRINV